MIISRKVGISNEAFNQMFVTEYTYVHVPLNRFRYADGSMECITAFSARFYSSLNFSSFIEDYRCVLKILSSRLAFILCVYKGYSFNYK